MRQPRTTAVVVLTGWQDGLLRADGGLVRGSCVGDVGLGRDLDGVLGQAGIAQTVSRRRSSFDAV